MQQLINSRLDQFASFSSRPDEEWFSELCFCLLTANAKAKTALNLQSSLGYKGFATLPQHQLVAQIRAHKHRFHNNKARYIVAARKHLDVKSLISENISSGGEVAARAWLVENIQGLGYKEASHFLRNTGHTDLAILDRHIINLLAEESIIARPSNLSKKNYLEIEKQFQSIAKSLSVSPAKLDLQLWYLQTGKVLK